MPILKKEADRFPENLFELEDEIDKAWLIYVMSRKEKELMRQLHAREIAFYGPTVAKRYRSPGGRFRTSYLPLFANYVFMFASDEERFESMKTNCISKYEEIPDKGQLLKDLKQIQEMIDSGAPLSSESKLTVNAPVCVKTGPFKGFEGHVIRREQQTRLLVYLNFIDQGVSIEIDECQLQAI